MDLSRLGLQASVLVVFLLILEAGLRDPNTVNHSSTKPALRTSVQPSSEPASGGPETTIAVVIPIYNAANTLLATLASVNASVQYMQRRADRPLRAEFVLVDDHSTDSSLAVAKKYAQRHVNVRVLQTPKNSGAGVARNVGWRATTATTIFFVDADDIYHQEHFEVCLKALDSKPGLAYVKTNIDIQPAANILPVWKRIVRDTLVQNMCIRRNALEFVEGFPPIELEDVWITRTLEQWVEGEMLDSTPTMVYVIKEGGRGQSQLAKFQNPVSQEPLFLDVAELQRQHRMGVLLPAFLEHLKRKRASSAPIALYTYPSVKPLPFEQPSWLPSGCAVLPYRGIQRNTTFTTKPVVIRVVAAPGVWMNFRNSTISRCDTACLWLENSVCPQTPDAVLFHCGTQPTAAIVDVLTPSQQLVYFCHEELPHRYGLVRRSAFDVYSTQSLDSDVPYTYVPRDLSLLLNPPKSQQPYLLVAIISSEAETSGRTAYLRELMRYVDVHSYGRVLNNRDMPALKSINGLSPKMQVIAKYRFTIAFENTVQSDYVTEKFYQPLMVGSVPVYLGAPNIDKFAPAAHSFVNAVDFTPQKLASHLKTVAADEKLYAEYHKWRLDAESVKSKLQQLAAMSAHTAMLYGEGEQHNAATEFDPCRLCAKIAERVR